METRLAIPLLLFIIAFCIMSAATISCIRTRYMKKIPRRRIALLDVVMLALAFALLACLSILTVTIRYVAGNDQRGNATGNSDEMIRECSGKGTGRTDGEILGGVYLNGGNLAEIKMAAFHDGSIQETCTVRMPTDYMFAAVYTDDTGQEAVVPKTGNLLQEILDEGILDGLGNPCSYVRLQSREKDNSSMSISVLSRNVKNMQDIKNYNSGGTDFGAAEHPAYYYTGPAEYAKMDLGVAYQINNDILLLMEYSGPLVEELGPEQLAQNMYGLVNALD